MSEAQLVYEARAIAQGLYNCWLAFWCIRVAIPLLKIPGLG